MKNKTGVIKQEKTSSGNPSQTYKPPFDQDSQPRRAFGWIIIPLRLFLGVTFVYGGIQKLTDPQYFNPAARGYIGRQIAAFASGSPLRGFLLNIALPHANLFGAWVAYGELAIGLAVLLGLLLRPAAFSGLLLNTVFFLSATWRVYPYFFGSDIVFMFCWLTLLLAGPLNSGLPALDGILVARLLQRVPATSRAWLGHMFAIILGVGADRESDSLQGAPQQAMQQGRRPPATTARVQYRGRQAALQRAESRRSFIWGAVTGGAGMLALAWLVQTLHLIPAPSSTTGQPQGVAVQAPTPTENASGLNGSGSTPSPGTSTTIARVGDVPANSATTFTIPSNGDPGVLVHLSSGQFVAYDAACTHAGCPVDYDPSSQHLVCPCHGAEFDPAHNGAVLAGPTNTPLTDVPIHVDNTTGAITLGS